MKPRRRRPVAHRQVHFSKEEEENIYKNALTSFLSSSLFSPWVYNNDDDNNNNNNSVDNKRVLFILFIIMECDVYTHIQQQQQ